VVIEILLFVAHQAVALRPQWIRGEIEGVGGSAAFPENLDFDLDLGPFSRGRLLLL
jgi:hypothetical protein